MTSPAAAENSSRATGEANWKALLTRVSTFPTLPVIVDKIAELVRLPQTTAREIEAVVATDQTLTARLLRLVNSPFYAFAQKVTTISRAVGLIGFEALRNLAFSTSVIQLFKSDASQAFEPEEFCRLCGSPHNRQSRSTAVFSLGPSSPDAHP